MASRPRPSLLALFDPLTIADASQLTPTRDELSPAPPPESGSDKENLISTTPKGCWTKSLADGDSSIQHRKGDDSRADYGAKKGDNSYRDLLGESFSLLPKTDDASNLCLVQLADELASACKTTDPEELLQRRQQPREPLSEISLTSSNFDARTPQSVPRGKRLINLDTPSTTPKSLRKFAAGIRSYESSTPPAPSPSATLQEGASRNLSPGVNSSSVVHQMARNAMNPASVPLIPFAPFTSNSPSFLSSTPVLDPSPAFHDPPSTHVGTSFEIHDSKMNFSGDLLNDDLSFLERLEDDTLAELVRGSNAARTNSSFSKTPSEATTGMTKLIHKPEISCEALLGAADELHDSVKTETPARKASTFRRSSSHSGLALAARRENLLTGHSSPVYLGPRTPSSSPFAPRLGGWEQSRAPKKTQTALRGIKTLMRSASARIVDTVKERSDAETGTMQPARSGSLRPRPSSMEIKPLIRPQSLAVKKADPTMTRADDPALSRRASVSRPSPGRRASVGRALSPTKLKPSGTTGQDELPKRPTTSLAQSVRRLSMSTSSKPAPLTASNFATTGRVGGARRVPLTANSPLYRPNETTIKEVHTLKPIPCAASLHARTGPQRPPISGASGTVGRSTSGRNVTTVNKAPSSGLSGSKIRTLGRTTSASSGLLSRSSFMTLSSSSMTSASRLPIPPPKSASRIPGPGARKAF